MATMLTAKCACGASTTELDLFDYELNYDDLGSRVTCSDACRAIRAARESWAKVYATA